MKFKDIKHHLPNIFKNTPDGVGVGYGEKVVEGQPTGEKAIIFTVTKKLPLSSLSSDQILPSTINLKGKVFKTDVVEVGVIEATSDCATCTDTGANFPPTDYSSPMKGGVAAQFVSSKGTYGTIGGFAVDANTGCLVGVTNAHVGLLRIYSTGEMSSDLIESHRYNTLEEIEASNPLRSADPKTLLGGTRNYVPIFRKGNTAGTGGIEVYNYVDVATFYITSSAQSVIDVNESWKQYGYDGITSPPPFATSDEIDEVIENPSSYPILMCGSRLGARYPGYCELTVEAGGLTIEMTYTSQNRRWDSFATNQNCIFTDQISLKRVDPECDRPSAGGDSGSWVLVQINGVWKVLGIEFAGSLTRAYIGRIDNAARELDLRAWDGSTPKFEDLDNIELFYAEEFTTASSFEYNGKIYYQVGTTEDIS
jgi:hypothetical protein